MQQILHSGCALSFNNQLISLDPLFAALASTKSSFVGDLDPVLNLNGDLAIATLLSGGTLSSLFGLPKEKERLLLCTVELLLGLGCRISLASRYRLGEGGSSAPEFRRDGGGIREAADEDVCMAATVPFETPEGGPVLVRAIADREGIREKPLPFP
jgi:hypothetical protein